MHTFDARLDPRVFWAAAFVPPVVFGLLVEGVVKGAWQGNVGLPTVSALMTLAYGLPLLALLYTVCSVAAYTIEPGRLVVHRVVRDRTLPLRELRALERLPGGVLRLRFDRRRLLVRTADPAGCEAALRAARSAVD